MKKLWLAVVMGIMFVAGIGIGFFAAKRSAAPPSKKTEHEPTLEEKMMGWIVNNKFPESPVKEKCVSVPVSLFPNGYGRYADTVTDGKIPVTEIDLDDDGQPEWLVYTGSGNRNTTYDIFKKRDGKWQLCGEIGGAGYFPVKYKGRTGILTKWGLGYGRDVYSYERFVNGKWTEIISFDVDGGKDSIPGKPDEIIIKLKTLNNFMKSQYR